MKERNREERASSSNGDWSKTGERMERREVLISALSHALFLYYPRNSALLRQIPYHFFFPNCPSFGLLSQKMQFLGLFPKSSRAKTRVPSSWLPDLPINASTSTPSIFNQRINISSKNCSYVRLDSSNLTSAQRSRCCWIIKFYPFIFLKKNNFVCKLDTCHVVTGHRLPYAPSTVSGPTSHVFFRS